MAEPSPREEPPPTSFLRKFIPLVPFQLPNCPLRVDSILREKLGILSPKEIYIPGPEHDNCTLQTDEYYTKGRHGNKEKGGKRPEQTGHGTRGHREGGECASHGHGLSTQGHSRSPTSANSPSMCSDEVCCLKNSHVHCEERGCLKNNSVSTSINLDSLTGNSYKHSNVNLFPPHEGVRPEGYLPKILDSYDSHVEGSSHGLFAKCTEHHDCCTSCSPSHDPHDEKSWNSSEGDTLNSSENRGTSRSSLKGDDSSPSSIGSSKQIRPKGHHTGSNLHESVGESFTHIYQTNGHIHDHTHNHTHDHIHDHTHTHNHKCCTLHSHSQKPPKTPREPPSKAEYLFGALVPPPPTYSSPRTLIPEHLVHKPETPKKAFLSPAGIGPITWIRSGKSMTNQVSAKQGSLGNVNVNQEISRQEPTETRESEDGLSRPEIHENIVSIGTTPRQSCDPNHATLEQALKQACVRFENSQQGNSECIEPKSPMPAKKHLRLPRPTHILPPTLNSSPGFSGFLWHDETGFLDKKVLEERFKTSQVLTQLLPNGYVQSRDRPSKPADSAERVRTPVEYSTDALESENLNLIWDSFEFLLTDYHIVCLVDDSLSMSGPPWLLASEIVPQIAPLCTKYSGAEGVDIRFVNGHSGKTDQVGLDPRDVRTAEKARNLFPQTPEGKKNPMGLELNKILSPYVRRWKQHGFSEEKPVDVIILTASAPSDYKVCVKSIIEITKELDRLGAPPAQICIQFFQISKVPAVTNELKRLSEELMRKCAGRKIVGTFLWNEQVDVEPWSAHVILDCVRKMVDRKIFAAPTKTIAGSKVPSCKCCT